MPGASSGARFFARNSNMAQKVAGGLRRGAGIVGGAGPHMTGMAGLTSGGVRSRAASALTTMSNYPRRTVAGAAGGLGMYGASRRRGSQNYPMY